MKSFRIALLSAALGLGCSPSYEYATPLSDPDAVTPRPARVAQNDTPECLPEGAKLVAAGDAGPPPQCCAGLTRAEAYKGSILRLDVCEPDDGGHAFCIRCGDGRCGVGENICTCKADCSWP